jgi:hypothetical protein
MLGLDAVHGRAPRLESELARGLCKHCFPDADDAALDEMLRHRNGDQEQRGGATSLDEEAVERMAELDGHESDGQEDDLAKEAAKEVVQRRARESHAARRQADVAARAASARSEGPVPAAAASSACGSVGGEAVAPEPAPAPAVPVRQSLELKYYTLQQARALMPVGRNRGQLSIHDPTHSWMAKYPTDVWPKSRSRAWEVGNMQSHLEALRTVLLWTWRHHTRLTGEQCPHDLGEPV